jgi:TolB-like protein
MADRPQSARELVQLLDAVSTSSGEQAFTSATRAAAPVSAVAAPRRGAVVGIAIAVVLIAAATTLWFRQGQSGATGDLRPRRLAVLPFENLTGDTAFAQIGRVAADWVTQGLSQVDSLDVVATLAVQQAIGDRSERANDLPAHVASATHAGRIVTGSITRAGDSIQITASMVDAASGRTLGSLGPITSPASDPMRAVTELRDRLLTSEASSVDGAKGFALAGAPTYAAYQQYIEGYRIFPRDQARSMAYFARAIRLDSSFAAPYMLLAVVHRNAGRADTAQRYLDLLEPRASQLNASMRGPYLWLKAVQVGDLSGALSAAKSAGARDSIPDMLYLTGLHASQLLRPTDGLPALLASDSISVAIGWAPQVSVLAQTYHQLGDHRRELERVLRGRREFPDRGGFSPQMFAALAGLRNAGWALALADTLLTSAPGNGGAQMSTVVGGAGEFLAHGDSATAASLVQRTLAWSRAHPLPTTAPARASAEMQGFLLLGAPDSAASRLPALLAGDSVTVANRYWEAVVAARRGNALRAQAISDSLGTITRRFDFGDITQRRAAIAAQLSRAGEAVQLLQRAAKEGASKTGWHTSLGLRPLKGNPEFEAMITPAR